jgi:hypothetical protein
MFRGTRTKLKKSTMILFMLFFSLSADTGNKAGTWEIIGSLGGLAGIVSIFIVLQDKCSAWKNKPKLKIYFNSEENVKKFTFVDRGWVRRVAYLNIKNEKKSTAKRCIGVLTFIEVPESVTHLGNELALHWGGIPYTLQAAGAQPIDIGSEPRKLDVAFTQEGATDKGCWIAIPIALSTLRAGQAYLLPGEYKVRVDVNCDNGKGDSGIFKIISTENWDGLEMHKLT